MLISLDDYFVDREKTPKDENGDYDYEALEAIDLVLFNDHLQRLMRGESVDIPRYDFITGHRTWHNAPLQLDERSILIVEGIHGLQPAADTRDTGRPEIQDLCVVLHVGGDGQSVADFDDGQPAAAPADAQTSPNAAQMHGARLPAGRRCAAAKNATSSPIRRMLM